MTIQEIIKNLEDGLSADRWGLQNLEERIKSDTECAATLRKSIAETERTLEILRRVG